MNTIRSTFLFLLLLVATSLSAEWSLYDGFDYNGKWLDGSDGGEGPWTSYWRPSMDGGMTIESSSLNYTQDRFSRSTTSNQKHTAIESSDTAGAYRDFSPSESSKKEALILWVSFLAQAKGAPFDSSGDEISIQLRSSGNVEWVTFGVMGRLDAWRIRLSDGSSKKFSDGAADIYTENVNRFVARITADTRAGQPDEVTLWVNPPSGRIPNDRDATLKLSGEDYWQEDVSFSRLRIGVINSGVSEPKSFAFDEIRMGETYEQITPSK